MFWSQYLNRLLIHIYFVFFELIVKFIQTQMIDSPYFWWRWFDSSHFYQLAWWYKLCTIVIRHDDDCFFPATHDKQLNGRHNAEETESYHIFLLRKQYMVSTCKLLKYIIRYVWISYKQYLLIVRADRTTGFIWEGCASWFYMLWTEKDNQMKTWSILIWIFKI